MTTEPEITPEAVEPEEISTPAADQTDDAATSETAEDADLADGEQAGDEGEGDEDDLVEAEWEGKTLRVTPQAKAALMRTADYTRKTQEVAEQRKALETERQALAQQAERAQEIDGDRVQLAVLDSQLKALDALDWDKLEEDEPSEANRLFRQRQRIRDRQIDLAGKITESQKQLVLDRQRSAQEARAKAVQETQTTLRKDIKGWNDDLATKVGEFAVTKLGWTPQQVLQITDAGVIKALHGAYTGDQAQRRLRQQEKLKAGDETPPVSRPGGGGASPNTRRTTDASGDKLSTAEWIERELARETAKRARR